MDASTQPWMLVNPLPSFLDTYSLSLLSLGCKPSCIVMSYLVLWFIRWSSLVNFKNGPEYLMRGTAQVFISLIEFLQCSLFSSGLLVLLRYPFLFLFHLGIFDGVSFQYSQAFASFLSSNSFDFFSWFGSSIPSIIYRFPLYILA